jgi:hypothetical protein
MALKKKEISKFKVGGINIEIGQKYVLDHMQDPNSKIGTKKFPFTGSGVSDCVNFDLQKNVYDTGFYDGSFCLQAYSSAEREELVPIYVNQIKKPFEEFRNEDLNHAEKNDFWKNFRYEAYVNKEFDTNKPDDIFELFQIIIQGLAVDKNEKNPFYRQNAQFTVSNPQVTKNKNKERSKLKLEAIQKLTVLAEGDKDKLDLVLNYVGREATNKVGKDDLQLIYFEVINDPKTGVDFAERFIEACDNYETPTGKNKMEYFHAINELFKIRKIKKDRRGFVTENGGVFLGNTLQDIATFCLLKDSSQAKAIEELIEQSPQVRREI